MSFKLVVEIKRRTAVEKSKLEVIIGNSLCGMKSIECDNGASIDLRQDDEMFAAVFQVIKKRLEERLKQRPKEVQLDVLEDKKEKSVDKTKKA